MAEILDDDLYTNLHAQTTQAFDLQVTF